MRGLHLSTGRFHDLAAGQVQGEHGFLSGRPQRIHVERRLLPALTH